MTSQKIQYDGIFFHIQAFISILNVIGLEVPHAHIHLVPINDIDDMNFSKPKLDLSKTEMLAIQEQIIKQG